MRLRTKKEYEDMLNDLTQKNHYQEALVYLDQIENKVADQAWLNFNRGRIYNDVGLYHLALPYLLNANIQLLDDIEIKSEIGWTYNRLEQFEKAIEFLDEVLLLGRDDYWINAELAYSYLEMELKEEAIVYLENALTFEKEDQWALTWLAHTYKDLMEFEKANEIYRQLYQLGDRQEEIMQALVVTNELIQNFDSHLDLLEEMTRLNYNSDFISLHLGTYYNLINEFENAIQSLEQIKQPNSDIYLELGYAYKQMEHYTIALDYYLKAYPTLTNNVFLVSEIAQIYELMEDYENELVYLKQASRLGREDLWLYHRFIYLYLYGLKDLVKARYYLDLAILMSPDDGETIFLYIEYEYMRFKTSPQWINKLLTMRSHNHFDIDDKKFELGNFKLVKYQDMERIYEFSEHLAYVENNSHGGFIDENGTLVIDFKLDQDKTNRKDTYMFNEQKAIVNVDGLQGLIQNDGKFLYEPIYDKIEVNDHYIHLEIAKTHFIVEHEKSYRFDFMIKGISEGLIPFKTNDLWGYMDINQNVIIEPLYQEASLFSEGLAMVKKDCKVGYINHQNEIIIPFEYESGSEFKNNLAILKYQGYYGIVDVQNNVVLPFEYDYIQLPINDYYIVENKNGQGCFYHHKMMISPQYEEMLPFFEGVARVKVNGYYGAINLNNEMIIEAIYDTLTISRDGIMIAGLGYRYGYINQKGHWLTPIMFQTATLARDHMMSVSFDGKFYLLKLSQLLKED